MQKLRVILTGATGMVGEGVLIECLQNDLVEEVLMVNRRKNPMQHPKLKELIVPDFLKLENYSDQIIGYDACFFCAGISSVGIKEPEYTVITYDTSLHFAKVLLEKNSSIIFNYVSGAHTDINSKLMWARVKGKTEYDLMNLGFKGEYNFRPGFMKPFNEQKNVKWFFKPIIFLYPKLLPGTTLSLQQVGRAMINVSLNGFPKQILEIKDIQQAAK